jgi:aspartate/methionine/tyrosine aminotransferase
MRFPTIEYMQWAKTFIEGDMQQIGGSGMPALEPHELELPGDDAIRLTSDGMYGSSSVRERLAALYQLEPAQIFPTEGTSLGNFLALAAVLDEGGDAVVETPVYTPLSDQVAAVSDRIDWVERPFEDGFELDPDRVAAAIRPDTRVVVVTNLHNPSGVQVPDEALLALAERAAKVGAYLLVDEAYRDFLFEDPPGCAARLAPNVISTGSLTKAYGLGHLRFGWVLGPEDVVHRASRINDYLGVLQPGPVASIGLRALDHLPRLRARCRRHLELTRPILRSFLETRSELDMVWPQSGPIAFPRLGDGSDTDELLRRLREEFRVVAVPGRFFRAPWGMRLSATAAPADLERGLSNLGSVLNGLVRT